MAKRKPVEEDSPQGIWEASCRLIAQTLNGEISIEQSELFGRHFRRALRGIQREMREIVKTGT
jgi:hypothetical protein